MATASIKEYSDFLRKSIKIKRPMKAVFDCSNGYAGEVLKETLRGVPGIRPIYLNARPDGDFPGHGPNPSSPGALDGLKETVIAKKADIGVAFDGDADRAIFVDDKGREVDSDDLIRMYVDSRKVKEMVVDIRIGWSIREKKNIKIFRTKVGNYHIKKAMIENDVSFGAERAGHYYFKIKGAYMDGAIKMALETISLLSASRETMSSLIEKEAGAYSRIPERNYEVKDKEAAMKAVKSRYMRRRPKFSDMDGISMEFKDFWFNIRPSANENLLRLNAEARTDAILQKELGVIESLIKKV